MATRPDLRFALLNDWQREFPLVGAPFAEIGKHCGAAQAAVLEPVILEHYRALLRDGAISRIGGVWGAGAGGAALLCAFAVAPQHLEAVAAMISAAPGVNHNYEREHAYNLWFVITGRDAAALQRSVDALEAQTGCTALRLRMQRAYRIDLGFDLRRQLAARGEAALQDIVPVAEADTPLAALVEGGVPFVPRPYDVWAKALQRPREHVLETLARWLRQGTLRRFGVIVRHHEAGFTRLAPCRPARRDAGLPARTCRRLALQPVLHGARPRPSGGTRRDPCGHIKLRARVPAERSPVQPAPLQAERGQLLPQLKQRSVVA
jgi:siroheme decarboxylase